MKNKLSIIHNQFKKNKKTLNLLSKFIKEVDNRCWYAVFGGFAIDAHYGEQTRFHEDLDMICWRNDIDIIRAALKKINFESEILSHPEEKELEYILKTTDENKIFSFQIADPIDDANFEISFWPYAHVKFPNFYLNARVKELNGVCFPVVAKEMLIELKKMQIDLYEKTKKENEEKYLFKQKQKHLKAIYDLDLLS